jgi:hypothetical protein
MPEPPPPHDDARPSVLEAVRFPFQGPDWTHNLLLGSVFVLIPLVGALALQGWMCEVLQRLERSHPRPVSKLDFQDFGHYLGRGVAPFVTGLVVGMSLWLLASGGLFVGLLGSLLVSRLSGNALLAGACWGLGVVLFVVGAVFATVLTLPAMLRAELTERIGAGLDFGKVLGFARIAWWQILYRTFLLTCLSVPLALGGYCLCLVGLYAAIVVILMATAHLRWQIYRYYLTRGGEPIAVKPAEVLPSEAPRPPFYPPAPGPPWR